MDQKAIGERPPIKSLFFEKFRLVLLCFYFTFKKSSCEKYIYPSPSNPNIKWNVLNEHIMLIIRIHIIMMMTGAGRYAAE